MTPHEEETIAMRHDSVRGIAVPAREFVIPRTLAGVRLVREIGRGGMGVVWLGHHDMLGRDVAVKFLLGAEVREDDPQFAVFLEGSRAAARLRAPGMTAVLHADVVEGAPYIVMEYIDGPTLARVLHVAGAFGQAAAVEIMRRLCETCAVLHDEGIVHRDLKPANVMVDAETSLYVTDFGIAVAGMDPSAARPDCGLAGTPQYMAPEAFDGVASMRTDVYALGVIFYELLTGAHPFSGDLDAIRNAHRGQDIAVEALRTRGVGDPVIDLVQRATRRDPKFRLKSARHLLEAIERLPFSRSDLDRAYTDVRGAALRSRTGENTAREGDITPARSLYDHVSTIAARKRAETPTFESALSPPTPPVSAPPQHAAASALSAAPAPTEKSPGTAPQAAPGTGPRAERAGQGLYALGAEPVIDVPPDDEARDLESWLRPSLLGWIGAGVFGLILLVIVIMMLISNR
ncbi:MAG: serine/threonine protein kinase [Phycisphaeraceae bacterium]|nr:serine/threonine protein kinase [Phycisphaeraceae bacterium]